MPAAIGDRALSDWCREYLGAPVAELLFTTGHLSAVYGLRLRDGREVVLKVRGGGARLGACLRVQRHMREAGFCCPEPLAGPHRLGSAIATAEALLPAGEQPALHDAPRLFAGLHDHRHHRPGLRMGTHRPRPGQWLLSSSGQSMGRPA
jgi:hypothetical protein